MAFRRSDLQEAFLVSGTYPFRVFGYGTADPLEAMLRPGYFEAARSLLRPGELIYVSTRAQTASTGGSGVRMALLMVRDGAALVRLVQDFGHAADPAPTDAPAPPLPAATAATPPPKRGRGRPPGSRNKKSE